MESVKLTLTPSVIQEVGEPDQYGNKAFSIQFKEGNSGFFKCKEQDLFTLGQPSEFYLTEAVGKSGKTYNKIQRVNAVEFDQPGKPLTAGTSESGSEKSKEDFDHNGMVRSVAVKAVCELRSQSSSITIPMVIEQAEELFDYLQFGITDGNLAPADGHKAALQTPEDVTNELPF